MGPVGRVPSNFGDNGDRACLVPSNFYNWLSFSPGNVGSRPYILAKLTWRKKDEMEVNG